MLIRKDGMVNATMLCKAMGKEFFDYQKTKQNQAFIEALKTDPNIIGTKLIIVKKGGDPKLQGSWVNRLIAIDVCRWGCPRFAVQITKFVDELLITGKVELQRPITFLIDLKDIDIEAEKLELENQFIHTNTNVLYIAYIGDGLIIKIGFSTNYLKRENKHLSTTETEYPQFRLIKLFEISSQNIETQIHSLLDRYRVSYYKQKEIYKPPSTLIDFINHIEILLQENDLQLQIQKLKMENLKLKNELLESKKENVKLHQKILELHNILRNTF